MSTHTPDPGPETDAEDQETPPPRWKRALVWGERVVTAGLLVFVAIRLGPQLGALTGVGPSLGSSPDYSFVTLSGDTVRSSDLSGKVVVLNFWATWCGPCKLEMPALQALHERSDTSRVAVIGLSTDVGGAAGIREFLAERAISYPVGRASNTHRQAFGGIKGIPTTFVIGPDGTIEHRVVGYFAPPAMRLAVSRLLPPESAPAP